MARRIGSGVYINSLSISDHNMLEFGDGVVIGESVHLSGHTVEGGVVKTGRVRLGRGVTVGLGSMVGIGVEAGERCQIGALSVVPKNTQARGRAPSTRACRSRRIEKCVAESRRGRLSLGERAAVDRRSRLQRRSDRRRVIERLLAIDLPVAARDPRRQRRLDRRHARRARRAFPTARRRCASSTRRSTAARGARSAPASSRRAARSSRFRMPISSSIRRSSPTLVAPILAGETTVVYGSRFLQRHARRAVADDRRQPVSDRAHQRAVRLATHRHGDLLQGDAHRDRARR